MAASEELLALARHSLAPPAPRLRSLRKLGVEAPALETIAAVEDDDPVPYGELVVFCELLYAAEDSLDEALIRRGLFQCVRGWIGCVSGDAWSPHRRAFAEALLTLVLAPNGTVASSLPLAPLLVGAADVLARMPSLYGANEAVPAYASLGCAFSIAERLLESLRRAAESNSIFPAFLASSLLWEDKHNPLVGEYGRTPRIWAFPVRRPGLRWTPQNQHALRHLLSPELALRAVECGAKKLPSPWSDALALGLSALGPGLDLAERRVDELGQRLATASREPLDIDWRDESGMRVDP